MYSSWQWPTAVNATDTSTVQPTTAATVAAVSASNVTPQWPTQTVAYGQYAVPATMQQPWAAAWQYAYPGNMAVGQVRPQYPQVLPGAFPPTAQTYQAPQVYSNANTVWPSSEGYQAVPAVAGETSAETKVEQQQQISQASDQNAVSKEETRVPEQPKQELAPKDEAEQEKLNQLRAQAQQWKSQQEAGPTWTFSPQTGTTTTTSTTTSTTALATPTTVSSTVSTSAPVQSQWNQGSWPQGSWNQGQWNQQQQWPQTWPQQGQQQQQTWKAENDQQQNSFQSDRSQPKPEETENNVQLQTTQLTSDQKGDDMADLDKEAEEFERQFVDWEKQFEGWKQQNINHPDREAFAGYEKQWQEWRNQLLQRREDMQRARAERKKLIDQEKQSMAEDKRPMEGQSPADVSQLTPTGAQGSFNTPAVGTPNVSQSGAAPNQMIPGLDHLRNDQTATPLSSQPGSMPAVTQPVTQGVPTIPNQNLYYPPQMPPGSAPQNLMFMQPPPHQFAFPSGPPPHSQAPQLHGQAPPLHSQVLPSHSQTVPPQNQVLPQHSQAPTVSQFQVPRHPPPPPPASGNVQNDTDNGKSYLSPDGFKNQDQKRTLLSTPPQHGNQGAGQRGAPPQGGPVGLLPLPPPDSRFGPPNREFGGHGSHDDMIESNEEYPSPHGMNVRHDFDRQDMMKEAERYMMMGDGEKNDSMGFENQDQYMSQQDMDQNKFQDGWGYGPDRGRGRGRGFDREMRPRGRGRGRGRESRWNDENEARQFEQSPENAPFPGESGNRNREFGDSSGLPRDFPESRRSTRWGPPSKPPPDAESNVDSDAPPADFDQKPDEQQFQKGHPSDQGSFSGKPFKGEEFKNRPRSGERGGFKESGGRPGEERSPFRDQFMGRSHGDDRGQFVREDFAGAPPGDEKGHFKGSEFMDRLPADDRGPFKGEEFMGRHPGAERSGFRGEEFRGRPSPGDSRKDEFLGKSPMDERGPFNKDDDFMGRPHGDRGPMKEGFPSGPPFKGRGFPPGGSPEEPFAGPSMDKKRISELHGDERFIDDQMPPPFAAFENERFPQGPMDKGERFPGRFREDDRFPPRGNPDDMFPHGRHPEPFLRGGERFSGRSGPLLGRDRFPPGPMSERERMSLMGPGPMMEPFDEDKFPPHMGFDRNFPRQSPFDDERFADERFPFREDPERFMGEERFHRGRFRDGRFGPKNFPPDELMGRPGILPGPDSPFLSRDAPFNIPDAPFQIPDAPFPIPDAPFAGLDHPFPPEEFRRNFPFDEDPRDPRFRLNFPDDRFPGPFPFDREKGPFDEPPFMGPGRRPHPFERGNERFDMRFSSIDYTHQPAVSVLGEEFTQKFDAFDQPYGADLMSYRDHHTSVLPFGTSSNQEKESAIFDYAHRRGESPHSRERSFRDRESDKNRDQDRSRERDRDRERERERPRDRERNRDRERERNRDRGRERDSEKDRDRDRKDRERDRTAHREERSRESKRDRDHDRDRDRTKDREEGESKRSRWEHQSESADRNFSKDRGPDSATQRQNGERTAEAAPDNVDNKNSAQLGPQPELFKTDVKTETVLIKDLLYPPGRFSRPKQLVIILRGLPGSGKTYVAKLIKDKEVENGGSAPRILSLDDYFMVEKEVTDVDPETGKRLKRREFQFEYEKDMEEAYRTSLYKSFKKTIDDRFFPFIIVDAIHDKVKQFEQYWSYAKQRGFQVYIAEMDCKDPIICHKRNVHNRSQGDVTEIMNKWEQKPQHFMDVDIRALLQDVSITEVEMEDLHTEEKKDEVVSKADDADDTDDFTRFHVPSRWEKLENTEEKLDKLDGLLGSKKKHSSMEDYLQLPDDYEERPCEPGKKRVRWADLEERKEQDRLRAIGFVVGQTDWTKMTDPSHAERALTRTKYI